MIEALLDEIDDLFQICCHQIKAETDTHKGARSDLIKGRRKGET